MYNDLIWTGNVKISDRYSPIYILDHILNLFFLFYTHLVRHFQLQMIPKKRRQKIYLLQILHNLYIHN